MVINAASMVVRKVVDCCLRCCWMVLRMSSCSGFFLCPILDLPVYTGTRGICDRIGVGKRPYLQFMASAPLSCPRLSVLPSGFAVAVARIYTNRQRLVVTDYPLRQVRICWFQAGCFMSILFAAVGWADRYLIADRENIDTIQSGNLVLLFNGLIVWLEFGYVLQIGLLESRGSAVSSSGILMSETNGRRRCLCCFVRGVLVAGLDTGYYNGVLSVLTGKIGYGISS